MPNLRLLGDTSFAMHAPALEQLLASAELRRDGGPNAEEPRFESAITRQDQERVDGADRAYRIGNVGVLPVHGTVRPRASEWAWLFGYGGFSLEHAARDLLALMEDPRIDAILLDVSSPGGMVEGVQEFAQLVATVADRKPIQAYASGMAASAAYWIPAATGRIVMNPTGEAGSIGVVATYMDWSRFDEQMGLREIEFVSSQSPNKRANPATEAGAALIQRRVDDLADVFVESVAAYRGVTRDDVIARFGAGDVMVGRRAVEAGLADDVGSFDEMLLELSRANRRLGMPLSENAMKQLKASVDGASVEDLRAASPSLVQSIEEAAFASGKEAGAAAGIEQGRQEGASEAAAAVEAERTRLATIDSLAVPGAESIIEAAKKNPQATAGDVAMKIVAAQREGKLITGSHVDHEASPIVPGMPGEPDADPEAAALDAAIDAAAKKGNQRAA